jgi:hypothetical protein
LFRSTEWDDEEVNERGAIGKENAAAGEAEEEEEWE